MCNILLLHTVPLLHGALCHARLLECRMLCTDMLFSVWEESPRENDLKLEQTLPCVDACRLMIQTLPCVDAP